MTLDFPTFERPIKATWGMPSSNMLSLPSTPFTNLADSTFIFIKYSNENQTLYSQYPLTSLRCKKTKLFLLVLLWLFCFFSSGIVSFCHKFIISKNRLLDDLVGLRHSHFETVIFMIIIYPRFFKQRKSLLQIKIHDFIFIKRTGA